MMLNYDRVPLGDIHSAVNGWTFFLGAIAFLLILGATIVLGIIVRETNNTTQRQHDENEFFTKIEEFRNDFN